MASFGTVSRPTAPPTFSQPTQIIALTTTFMPSPTCTENRLSMLSSPGFFIWANEPVPVPMVTMSDCFPSEFLESYTSVDAFTNGTVTIPASSIVPAMSPLVCPLAWNTVFTSGSYIACCPSGFNLHAPTPAPLLRAAYGGTCFSDFTLSQAAAVTGYNSASVTGTVQFVAHSLPAQAFAHPIDGWALRQNGLSSGGIIGIVLGGTLVLVAGLAIIYLRWLRKRRQEQKIATESIPGRHMGELRSFATDSSEADATSKASGPIRQYELAGNHAQYELPASTTHYELPADTASYPPTQI